MIKCQLLQFIERLSQGKTSKIMPAIYSLIQMKKNDNQLIMKKKYNKIINSLL